MNAAVLVLDVGMRPLRVEPWQRAICDFFTGKIEVVEYSKDKTIHSATRAWPMPSVVRLANSFKRERIRVKFSRVNIYTRDGFKCQYCGHRFMSEDLTFDHVLPRSRGAEPCGRTSSPAVSRATRARAIGPRPRRGCICFASRGSRLTCRPSRSGWIPATSRASGLRTGRRRSIRSILERCLPRGSTRTSQLFLGVKYIIPQIFSMEAFPI